MDCITRENQRYKENIVIKSGIISSHNQHQTKKIRTDDSSTHMHIQEQNYPSQIIVKHNI